MYGFDKYNPNTRLIDLTVGQLVELIEGVTAAGRMRKEPVEEQTEPKRNYVYGLDGIAKILNCSRGTVCRLKKLGAFDGAVSQCGHLITTDADKVLECANEFYKKNKKQNKSKKQ